MDIELIRLDMNTDQVLATLVQMIRQASPEMKKVFLEIVNKVNERQHQAAIVSDDPMNLFRYFEKSLTLIGLTQLIHALERADESETSGPEKPD